MVTRLESVNPASSRDCAAASAWVQSSTFLRSSRSTHTPAKGASRKVGIWPTKPTRPNSRAEPVSR